METKQFIGPGCLSWWWKLSFLLHCIHPCWLHHPMFLRSFICSFSISLMCPKYLSLLVYKLSFLSHFSLKWSHFFYHTSLKYHFSSHFAKFTFQLHVLFFGIKYIFKIFFLYACDACLFHIGFLLFSFNYSRAVIVQSV